MKMRRFHLSVLLFLLAVESGQGQTEAAQNPAAAPAQETAFRTEDGVITGNTYHNYFFGFTCRLPERWEMIPLRQAESAVAGRVALLGLRRTFDPAEVSTLVVFADSLPAGANPSLKEHLLATEIKEGKFQPVRATEEFAVEGQMFVRETSREKLSKGELWLSRVLTIQKGFGIQFLLLSNRKARLDDLEKMLRSFSFSPPPVSKAETAGGWPVSPFADGRLPGAPPRPSPQQIEAAGSVSDGVYTNSFLKLSYRYPPDLAIQQAKDWREVMRVGHRLFRETPPEKDPEHQVAEKRSSILLVASRPQSPDEPMPDGVLVLAFDAYGFPKQSNQYLAVYLTGLLAGQLSKALGFDKRTIFRPPQEIYFGGQLFSHSAVEASSEQQGHRKFLYLEFAVTTRQDYALTLVLIAPTEKRLIQLTESLYSLRFSKWPYLKSTAWGRTPTTRFVWSSAHLRKQKEEMVAVPETVLKPSSTVC